VAGRSSRTAVAAALVLSSLGAASCGDTPASPSASSPALTETVTSSHYVIHLAPGDAVNAVWQDQYYEWLVGALQLQPSPRLDYHKYRDRAHLRALTGRDTNGFAEPRTTRFHTIWPIDNHEGVHVLVMLQIGHPPALFNEGVAVAHQTDPPRSILTPQWNGTDLHQLARQYDADRRLPALSSLLSSRDFFASDDNVTYPCAGSFVRYLIDRHGLRPLKQYVGSATFDDAAAVTEARFLAAYNQSLSSAWTEWIAWLRAR
jgi:hypothetical protein